MRMLMGENRFTNFASLSFRSWRVFPPIYSFLIPSIQSFFENIHNTDTHHTTSTCTFAVHIIVIWITYKICMDIICSANIRVLTLAKHISKVQRQLLALQPLNKAAKVNTLSIIHHKIVFGKPIRPIHMVFNIRRTPTQLFCSFLSFPQL